MIKNDDQAKPAGIVRIVACGSVDDGKSTLIGRLLFETGSIYQDEQLALANASLSFGTRGSEIDYALLLDGLAAEREQGITIDVSWRHLQSVSRRFLIADCPGHAQYTRNMATGASLADIAIVLVDASLGLQAQSFQHLKILSLFGVPQVLLAVNKMDKVQYQQSRFAEIEAAAARHASLLGITNLTAIPIAAAMGANVFERSAEMPWYRGMSLWQQLLNMPARDRSEAHFAMPVQNVLRDAQSRRWLTGTIAAGAIKTDELVEIYPAQSRNAVEKIARVNAQVAEIHLGATALSQAQAGQAIALRLADNVDVGRGAVLAGKAQDVLLHSDQFSAHLLWFADQPMLPSRRYWLKLACSEVQTMVSEIRCKIDPVSNQELAAKRLEANDIAIVTIACDHPIVASRFADNQTLGSFILVDQQSAETLACGLIRFGLRRAENLHWQHLDITRSAREIMKRQRALCVWFTGLSGAGKSTIANALEKQLFARGLHSYLLDGDNVRQGLNHDLGFSDQDRVENLRRVGEVARLMTDAGLIVLVSFISPFAADRAAARARFDAGRFIEVFVDTPIEIASERDPKGLYAKARAGKLPNFTGIDSPYEKPIAPDVHLDTSAHTVEENAWQLAEMVMARMTSLGD